MCFLGTCQFSTKERGKIAIKDLKYTDVLLDNNNNEYEIVNIYKLPEFKVVKMVRIQSGQINGQAPTSRTYLKPTHYLKLDNLIIKAKDLVDKYGLAEYEKHNIIYFYLLNVRKRESEEVTHPSKNNIERINDFLEVNGLNLSVYNTLHPLNNRFQKFSVENSE